MGGAPREAMQEMRKNHILDPGQWDPEGASWALGRNQHVLPSLLDVCDLPTGGFRGSRPRNLSSISFCCFFVFMSYGAVFIHGEILFSCSTKGPQGTRRMIEDFSRPELSIFTVRKTAQSQEKSSRTPGNMCLLVLVFYQQKQRSPGRESSISFLMFPQVEKSNVHLRAACQKHPGFSRHSET